jgi:curved DNA-binding protein CbpA
MMEAAFSGFAALPERTEASAWYRVLNVPINASLEQAETAYREAAKVQHPDNGGDQAAMAGLNLAIAEARRAIGNL